MVSGINNLTASPLADYNYWFSQSRWTLKEAAALVVGLNPDVALNPEIRTMYDNNDMADDAKYKIWHPLWLYSEEAVDTWHEVLDRSERDIEGSYCASAMGDIVDDHLTVRPMDFIQRCVDDNTVMHYSLHEYLQSKGYDFRFSKNSRMLSYFMLYAKKDIWFMPSAARLVLGLPPESTSHYLQRRQNLYRHMDANYTLTQRDEVYHIMESALQSWKTKNLEFFEIHGGDPEENYYNIEECPVYIEAKKFIDWAIKKGFAPPVQLLELIGLKVAQKPEDQTKPVRPQETTKPMLTKEKETLLKMIIGMAVKGYGYDLQVAKSPTPKEICDDLAERGISLDVDTIRNKLKEAAQFLPSTTDAIKPKSVMEKPKSAKSS